MIDFEFLKQLEGFETEGYVPMSNGEILGNSGVTIASGLDLGQQSVYELYDMGIPEHLISLLYPYLGKKKEEAVWLLSECPLKLTEKEANIINRAVKQSYVKRVEEKYNSCSSIVFKELPIEIRTVIVSVLFQYGLGAEKRIPNFWRQVVEGDWEGALSNLRNFGDRYGTRRRREADLLEVGLERIRH